MFTDRESLRSRIRRLPNWVLVALIVALVALGIGLVLLLLSSSPTPSIPAGPSAPSNPAPAAPMPSPYLVPSANESLQPSYVAPLPTADGKTLVRVNQLSVNPTSASDKTAPLTLSIFVSVATGPDLGADGLAFVLTLADGSAVTGKPRADATGGSYWVDFTIPSRASSGNLVVSGSAGQNVLLSQVLTWPLLP